MKPCSMCSIPKALSEFNKLKASPDGYRRECRSCSKKYYEANKEREIERSRKYRENNPEQALRWRKENRSAIIEYNKKYYAKNKESIARKSKGSKKAYVITKGDLEQVLSVLTIADPLGWFMAQSESFQQNIGLLISIESIAEARAEIVAAANI